MDPYIGVTGFMSQDEVRKVLEVMPYNPPRKLMVGVLASSKTLRGEKNKYPGRYLADLNLIGSVFILHPYVLNLIHYATDDKSTLPAQLETLIGYGGTGLQGFQLNVAWPEPEHLKHFTGLRFVLQIGSRAMDAVGRDPEKLADKVAEYGDLIHYALIDPSGGKGIPFDAEMARKFLTSISRRCPTLGLGVAGGLSPETFNQVEPLIAEFPDLSIDAEGRLRTAEDALDVGRAREYLERALAMFRG